MFKAVQGTLRAKLKTFDTRIHHIIDDVDKSANIDTLRDMKSQFTALEGKVDNALGMFTDFGISKVLVFRHEYCEPGVHLQTALILINHHSS